MKSSLFHRWKTKHTLQLSILLIFLFLFAFGMRNAGYWLIRNDAPRHAGTMVVLMGSIGDRALQASDLYGDSITRHVLVVEEGMQARLPLTLRGVQILSNTTQCKNAMVQLGIPADSINIIPGDVLSTAMEAIAVASYLKKHPVGDTIVLVTSPDHTRRAALIFENAFHKAGLHVTVTCSPSPYNSFNPKGWYTRKEDIQQVVFEYIKLAAFWGGERWKSS